MQNYLFPLWVALGGALGSLCRYGTTIYMARMAGTYFPFGTLAVNGAGSFLIGLLSVLLVKAYPNPAAAAFLITGFLGGLTTFSSFSAEITLLLQQGRLAWACGTLGAQAPSPPRMTTSSASTTSTRSSTSTSPPSAAHRAATPPPTPACSRPFVS